MSWATSGISSMFLPPQEIYNEISLNVENKIICFQPENQQFDTENRLWMFYTSFYGMLYGFIALIVLEIIVLYWHSRKNPWRFKGKSVYQMTAFGFEDFCCHWLDSHWRKNIKQTKRVKDGGYDIKARKQGVLYYIECKRYTKKTIGVVILRSLFGVAQSMDTRACRKALKRRPVFCQEEQNTPHTLMITHKKQLS